VSLLECAAWEGVRSRARARRGALFEALDLAAHAAYPRDGRGPRSPVPARLAALWHAHPAERCRGLPDSARALARAAEGRGRRDVHGILESVLPMATDGLRPAYLRPEEYGGAGRAPAPRYASP